MNKTAFFILLFFATSTYAKCLNGTIKFTFKGEERKENTFYCFDEKMKSIASKNCVLGKCQALKAQKVVLTSQEYHSTVGSPSYRICYKAGGIPQVISFWQGKRWINTTRCLFDDNSFINSYSIPHTVKDTLPDTI